ncbi:hypothetical protein [Roseovarius mucosus]|uniref:hypothetical protein n=1 Tax=Roseovarius mucosus TaxID=215743 RepID=UPI003F70BA56
MRCLCLVLGFVASSAAADHPDILGVQLKQVGTAWNIAVTVLHPDTGWDHYVDGWEVLDATGNRLGYRLLHHPHAEEQPFTRSLNGLPLPEGTQEVFVRAHCSVDGWSTAPFRVELRR